MYLSRLSIDGARREGQKVLADAYRLHQMVMGGFKAHEKETLGRVLFRLEPEMNRGMKYVLVQSFQAPDWNHLPDSVRIESKAFSPAFKAGETLAFRLRANPVVTREGKRRGLIGEEAQTAWLRKKEIGVIWREVLAIDEGYTLGRKNGSRVISHKSVLFQGSLHVENVEKLLFAVAEGIGPAKGFGFGLLSLSRLR